MLSLFEIRFVSKMRMMMTKLPAGLSMCITSLNAAAVTKISCLALLVAS